MNDNDVTLAIVGLVALVVIAIAIKPFAIMWLWNSFLISWAGLSLPVIGWGKAFCVGVCLSIAVNGFFNGSSNKRK